MLNYWLSFPNLEEGAAGGAHLRAASYCLGNSAKKKKKVLKITKSEKDYRIFLPLNATAFIDFSEFPMPPFNMYSGALFISKSVFLNQ